MTTTIIIGVNDKSVITLWLYESCYMSRRYPFSSSLFKLLTADLCILTGPEVACFLLSNLMDAYWTLLPVGISV